MKRARGLVGCVLIAASLSGCGSSNEEVFLERLRDRVPEFVDFSDEQLAGETQLVCDRLERGETLREQREMAIENFAAGTPDGDAINRIISMQETEAAVYCPELIK